MHLLDLDRRVCDRSILSIVVATALRRLRLRGSIDATFGEKVLFKGVQLSSKYYLLPTRSLSHIEITYNKWKSGEMKGQVGLHPPPGALSGRAGQVAPRMGTVECLSCLRCIQHSSASRPRKALAKPFLEWGEAASYSSGLGRPRALEDNPTKAPMRQFSRERGILRH